MHTGEVEQVHFFIGGFKVSALKAAGQSCAARAMAVIHMFVEAPGIVKESKKLYHMPVGTSQISQH